MAVMLIDSNVLIDVATAEPTWADWSMRALDHADRHGGAAINPLIYAEVSVSHASIESLESVLPADKVQRLALPYEAAFLAGKAFAQYRRDGGQRRSPLPDFYIGAHAAISDLILVTRDPRRYRRHFPRLRLIAPDTMFTELVPAG